MKKSFMLFLGIVALSCVGVGIWFFLVSPRISRAVPIVPITVFLKWYHQSQFAGHYVAREKGWYADAGLDVTLQPFDYKRFPIDEVVSGNADFGVAGADELLVARSKGIPIKALAVIYQENPVVAYTLASSGIKKPVDFIGKTIGIEQGVNVETIIQAMLTSQGIDYKKNIKEVPIGFDVKPLLDKTVDIATGYVTNEPIQVEEAGQEVTVIAPYEYGVKSYADVLFTTEEMLTKYPDRVRGFVQATLKGWEYALEHIDEAVQYTLLYKDPNNTSMNAAHQKALLVKSMPLIKSTAGGAIGQMNYVDWKRTYQLLRDSNAITGDIDVSAAYVTDFIHE